MQIDIPFAEQKQQEQFMIANQMNMDYCCLAPRDKFTSLMDSFQFKLYNYDHLMLLQFLSIFTYFGYFISNLYRFVDGSPIRKRLIYDNYTNSLVSYWRNIR